jgi:hypothetical protein
VAFIIWLSSPQSVAGQLDPKHTVDQKNIHEELPANGDIDQRWWIVIPVGVQGAQGA